MSFDPTETAPRLRALGPTQIRRYLTPVFPQVLAPMDISDRRVVLGRVPGQNVLVLDDNRASRAHAELAVVRGEHDVFRLRDLESKNGTFLDGHRVGSEYLRGSGVVRVGDSLLVFSEVTVPPGMEPPAPALGSSAVLTLLEQRADRAGATGLPVLIRGPSGAGKERLSQRLHRASKRAGPLVVVNCATFSGELLASELFGHARGAFSGANTSRDGLFVSARGGTLFLDEIAEMPLDQQPALLRALQEGRIRPVGADHEVQTDVRVIAASHQDLRARVDANQFRGDLFARLAGVHLELPGLAERREEILPLFNRFLQVDATLSPEAAEALLLYDWPYNVRELQHTAGGLQMYASAGDRIELGMLPEPVRAALESAAAEPTSGAPLDQGALIRLLRAHGGNVSSAAKAVEQSRQQLYRRLTVLGLDPSDYREGS